MPAEGVNVTGKLGIIAGGGDLPAHIARHAKSAGREVFILGVLGFVAKDLLEGYDSRELSIGETGAQIRALKDACVEELCFAGNVKRPNFKNIKLDGKGLKVLPKVLAAAGRGDDALMRTMLNIFEREGFRIVGADEVLEDLLAPRGALGALSPSAEDWPDIRRAAQAAAEIGRLDIGQAAVSCRGLILAVEAQEGTEQMLARCADLPAEIRGSTDNRTGVLVKRPKPGQERRIDLPTIGVATVRQAESAHLSGIALEAGSALILDMGAVRRAADDAGLWIYGFQPMELDG